MAYTIGRIGKALVKYFKPIRVARPHLPGDAPGQSSGIASSELSNDLKGRFKLLKFKKPEQDRFAESKARPLSPEEQALELAIAQLPEKAPGQWLDLVIHLLTACKRASVKMSRGIGLQTYRQNMLNRSKGKFKTVGSIINTSGEDENAA